MALLNPTRRDILSGCAAFAVGAFPLGARAMSTNMNIGIFGQSFSGFMSQDAGWGVFKEELETSGYQTIYLSKYCVSGSSALRENSPDGPNGTKWWWDVDSMQPGPLLRSCIANVINKSNHKPYHFMLMLGEQDAVMNADPERWKQAIRSIVWELKKACNPSNPNSIEALMHVYGRTLWQVPGVQVMREALFDLFDTTSIQFLCDIYDLPLRGSDDPLERWPYGSQDRHHLPLGNATMGFRGAQKILELNGKPDLCGPKVTNIIRNDANSVDLTIQWAPELDLVRPEAPSEWAVRNGATLYQNDLSFEWVNPTTLRLTAPYLDPGAKVLFPYGDLINLNRDGLIKDTMGTPLNSLVLTAP